MSKTVTFIYDKVSRRPACALLQAVYGGDAREIHRWEEWQIAPTDNFVRVTATIEQIEERARQDNERERSHR